MHSQSEQLNPMRMKNDKELLLSSTNAEMERVLNLAQGVAETPTSLLLTGESGTGKEVLARFVHNSSPRRSKAFVAVNCGAVPATLMESELFGHEKGAFSGADTRRLGKFEQADGGTLLLDEISELPYEMQSKLLRVLQESEVDRLGGTKPISVDVRIIATTNRNLKEMVRNGEFREDLYYRINVFPLWVPSLRKRLSDVPALCSVLLGRIGARFNQPVPRLTKEALNRLQAWNFPGNIRELNNILERAVILGREGVILPEHIILEGKEDRPDNNDRNDPIFAPMGLTLREMEREAILRTLDLCDGNRTHTSEKLGISIRTLRNRLREYRTEGFSVPDSMAVKGMGGENFAIAKELAPCH